MAGNALVMLLQLHPQVSETVQFSDELEQSFGNPFLPVFYPIIREGDVDWHLLNSDYLYHFKNELYRFHNDGAWPVF